MPDISIIIRSKNEERWITHCLRALLRQSYTDFEIILVDNLSTDGTVRTASRFPVTKILEIDKFLPGKALNDGIRASSGNFIVCLSAHCIPQNQDWLSCLRANFSEYEKLAGVYGRQLPISYTNPIDKRDLLTVFGLEKRLQLRDFFFHNANSMIRRDVWQRIPFDEDVTNVEDRVWAKAVTEAGFHILYDPHATVYHHHGLNQGNEPKRAEGVVSIIGKIEPGVLEDLPESMLPENINVAAIVPIRGAFDSTSPEYEQLSRVICWIRASKYISSIYLVSEHFDVADSLKVKWVDRGLFSDGNSVPLNVLLQNVLTHIESLGDFPDSVIYVNHDYLHRKPGLIDELVRDAQFKGYDCVFPALVDFGHYWIKDDLDDYRQIDPSLHCRDQRRPIYRALYGAGCLASTSLIRSGTLIGGKIGILPLDEPKFSIRLIHTDNGKY